MADIDVYPQQPVFKWIPRAAPQLRQPGYRHSRTTSARRRYGPAHLAPFSSVSTHAVLAKPGHRAIIRSLPIRWLSTSKISRGKGPGGANTFEDVMSTTGPFAFTKALMDYFREQTVGRCHMKTHPKGGMPWSLPNVCYCLVAGQSSGLRCLGGIDIDFAFNWILCWSVILFLFAHTLFLLLTTLPISTFR